jgi:ArsR family transcriptional regulator
MAFQLSSAQFAAKAGEAADLLRVLGHEARLMVLCQLVEGEHAAGALQDGSGLSQSALSQHLAKLRDAGLVATRREAQTIFYRLADAKAQRVLETLAALYCPPTKRTRK